MTRYIIAALVLLGVAGCTEENNTYIVAPVPPADTTQVPPPSTNDHYAKLVPAVATELLLDASVYDGSDVTVGFRIRCRGVFNTNTATGHAYGRHLEWALKLGVFNVAQPSVSHYQMGGIEAPSVFFSDLVAPYNRWSTVTFRRRDTVVSLTIDGNTVSQNIPAYTPHGDPRMLAFKSMDADIDDLMIVVDGQCVGWWDFENGFTNKAGYSDHTFTGFTITPY